MKCRRRLTPKRFLQLILGISVAALYIQFQLLWSADKYDIVKRLRRAPKRSPRYVNWNSYCGLRVDLNGGKQTGSEPDYFSSWRNVGALNEFLWQEIRGADLNSLLKHPLFPKLPSNVGFVQSLNSSLPVGLEDSGRWVFGFLHPDLTGEYKFAIASDDSSEFWISTSDDHEDVRMVSSVGERNDPGWTVSHQHTKYHKQISERMLLHKCHKYFIEIFHKQAHGLGFVELSWIRPGSFEFEIIGNTYISPFIATDTLRISDLFQRRYTQLNNLLDRHVESREEAVKAEGHPGTFILPFLRNSVVEEILPHCPYKPSHLNRERDKHGGITDRIKKKRALAVAQVYPLFTKNKIKTEDFHQRREALVTWQRDDRDYVLSGKVALGIVNKFMSALHAYYPGGYSLHAVYSVERYRDESRGDRFFLDVSLRSQQSGRAVRLAEYAYRREHSVNQLCFPEGLQWRKDAPVYVIVTARNQTKWVHHLIESIGVIQSHTEDRNIHVILLDYGNNGLQIEGALETSPVTCSVIKASGPFHQTQAIQRASKIVTDPHSILLSLDVHMQLPSNVFDQVRKHCVEGLMVFSPVLFRLERGYHPENPVGSWEGHGIFAVYKSDWVRFGGMDLNETTTQREMLSRFAMAGLEVARTKLNNFYHLYHTH